jgi:hypothetical protein
MIRERCSCGAEFETDEKTAVRLVRDWRETHRHDVEPATEERDATIESSLGFSPDPRLPELHVGFKPDPFD